jgi:uncharacterized protein (DUF433 family)
MDATKGGLFGADMRLSFDRIDQNPEVCFGEPIIRGTRITCSFVYRLIQSGMQIRDVLEAYPQLEEKDIRQAIEFVRNKPGRVPAAAADASAF